MTAVSAEIHESTNYDGFVMQCVTCRTGLNTTMGSMIRELLAPSTQAVKQDPFVAVRILPALACHDTGYLRDHSA